MSPTSEQPEKVSFQDKQQDETVQWLENPIPPELFKKKKMMNILISVFFLISLAVPAIGFIMTGGPVVVLILLIVTTIIILVIFERFVLRFLEKMYADRIGLSRRGVSRCKGNDIDFLPWDDVLFIMSISPSLGVPGYSFYKITGKREIAVFTEKETFKRIVQFLRDNDIEVPITKDMIAVMEELGYKTRKIWLETVRLDFHGNVVFKKDVR